MTTASLRFLPLGQIHMAFSDVHLSPGSGNHRLVLPVKVTGTWLNPDAPTFNAAALLVGTAWTDQPYFRWLAGLEPQVITLRGFAVGEELILSLSDEQLIALERARARAISSSDSSCRRRCCRRSRVSTRSRTKRSASVYRGRAGWNCSTK